MREPAEMHSTGCCRFADTVGEAFVNSTCVHHIGALKGGLRVHVFA